MDGALEQIKKNAPEEFSKLDADPKAKDTIAEAARAAAAEEVKLAHEFTSRPDQDIRVRLAKFLPEYRIKLIEEALSIPTFRMEITQTSDGKHWVQLTRDGKEFLPGKALAIVADTEWASFLQEASILVEAVILVMHAVGIALRRWNPVDGHQEFMQRDEMIALAIMSAADLIRKIANLVKLEEIKQTL
ncbi:hypothetical protein ACROYT_G031368 [Oculina patagonica]